MFPDFPHYFPAAHTSTERVEDKKTVWMLANTGSGKCP
jgi:hypothetical protein